MGYWDSILTPATFSGGAWNVGDLTSEGDLCATDLILHSLRASVIASPKIVACLAGDAERCEVVDAMPRVFDARPMPRIYIFAGSISTDRAPVSAEVELISASVAIAYSLTSIAAVPPGRATLASVLHLIKRRIQAIDEVIFSILGQETNIIENMTLEPHQTLQFADEQLRPFVEMQIITAIMEAHVNHVTGRLQQIERAGG